MLSSPHSSTLRRRCTIRSQFPAPVLHNQDRDGRAGLRHLARSLSATSGASGRLENTWKEYFADPSQWWDDRSEKTHPKAPDFKHRFTRHALWIDSWSNPPWVTRKLIAVPQDKAQHYGGANIQVPQGVAGQDSSRPSVNDHLGWRGNNHTIGTERSKHGLNNVKFDTNRHKRTLIKRGEAMAVLHKFDQQSIPLDSRTYVKVLQMCCKANDLEAGKQVHDHIIQSGVEPNIYVVNNLMKMYVDRGAVMDARQLFDKLVKKDVFTWTIMIGGYVQNNDGAESMEVFRQMLQEGVEPDRITYMSILNACGSPVALEWGKEVHTQALKAGLECDMRVGTALVKMYAKCGSIKDARKVFDKLVKRDVVSWTVMIGAYAESGHVEEAFEVFLQMRHDSLNPDAITYLSILNACSSPGALKWVKEVHGQAIKAGYDSDVRVGTSLVKTYAKCGSIQDARILFDKMGRRSIISWTVMIGAYAESGHGDEAFETFLQMQQEGWKPDAITFLSVLNPCASPGALEWVKEVHSQAVEAGLESNVRVGNAFVNMYAKCGSIKDAQQVFDKMVKRDVISWNVMIVGLAQHGCCQDALQYFEQMKREGLKPDEVTFVGVLSACAHSGLVDDCRRHFSSLSEDYGIIPTIEHYGCMVDLLGRAGHLDEAEDVIKNMPLEAGVEIWGALLGACKIHCNVKLAEHAAEQCLKLEPQNAGVYVLLSNVYAAAGMWDHVMLVRNLMKERGVVKEPGRSWIRVDKKVHSFVAEDRSHPQAEKIYSELKRLTTKLKRAGYVPDIQFVMPDMDEQQKEEAEALCSHSEKLAIAYGLISTTPGTPIRIFKNLRVCSDCHTATKFISKVVGREIVARDANRFHHFKDGLCSCGDYW